MHCPVEVDTYLLLKTRKETQSYYFLKRRSEKHSSSLKYLGGQVLKYWLMTKKKNYSKQNVVLQNQIPTLLVLGRKISESSEKLVGTYLGID